MGAEGELAEVLGLGKAAGALSQFDLIDVLDAGLPLAALTRLASRVAPADTAFAFRLVPRATLSRRRKERPAAPTLSSEEGAKVARLASVWALARQVWGEDEAARDFLNRPHALLNGQAPLDVVLKSEFGGPLVEGILGRLRYGSAA